MATKNASLGLKSLESVHLWRKHAPVKLWMSARDPGAVPFALDLEFDGDFHVFRVLEDHVSLLVLDEY
jgi:hypothetical protein